MGGQAGQAQGNIVLVNGVHTQGPGYAAKWLGMDREEASEEPNGSGQDFARLVRAARVALLCHGISLAHEYSADSSKSGR